MEIYIVKDNEQRGPFTKDEIRRQIAAGALKLADQVWWQGLPAWQPLGETNFSMTEEAPVEAEQASVKAEEVPVKTEEAPDRTEVVTVKTEELPAKIEKASEELPTNRRKRLAMTAVYSLLCGLLPFGFPFAIFLGLQALDSISRDKASYGQPVAVIGLILGLTQPILLCIAYIYFQSAP